MVCAYFNFQDEGRNSLIEKLISTTAVNVNHENFPQTSSPIGPDYHW